MNSFKRVDPALVDYRHKIPTGYTPKQEAEDKAPGVMWDACGAASKKMPKGLQIDPRNWADAARDNDKYFTHPMNYIDRYTMQDPTHECTTHSGATGFAGCRNRKRGVHFQNGPVHDFRYPQSAEYGSVWVSPQSIYAQVNPKTRSNPKQRGGANVREICEVGIRTGFLPDKIQPREYNFKHTLHGTSGRGNKNQSSGPYISVNDFPEGWEETAKWFRITEVIHPESWEDCVSLVLHGYFVCVGRNGHAIPWGQWLPIEQKMAYPDSYNVTRYDSLATVRRAWQGAFAITAVVTPDDWLNPASDTNLQGKSHAMFANAA